MQLIDGIKREEYMLINSFYEINAETMWACKDTVGDLQHSQSIISKLKDAPITIDNHTFDE